MKILTILGHPTKNSFNHAVLKQYIKGAKQNNQVKTIYLGDLKFNPILQEGYKQRQVLEPDLKSAQKLIKWADKITLVYPTWWGAYPALLKGFFERIFLPHYAYKYTGPYKWKKLLKGRTARIIVTMDAPLLYYKFIIGDPGYKLMKATLAFCGIKPIQKTYISGLKFKNKKRREKILKNIYKIGLNEK